MVLTDSFNLDSNARTDRSKNAFMSSVLASFFFFPKREALVDCRLSTAFFRSVCCCRMRPRSSFSTSAICCCAENNNDYPGFRDSSRRALEDVDRIKQHVQHARDSLAAPAT